MKLSNRNKKNSLISWIVGFLVASLIGSSAFAQDVGNSGSLSSFGQFGPFDYRTERGNSHNLVEGAHLTAQVEALIRGKTGAGPGGDIDYTLRAFPKHHRALVAMKRSTELERKPKPSGARYSIDCYFHRAILFRPDDTTARMLFSRHLGKTDRASEAIAHLGQAVTYAKENSFTHFNIGLIYFDMKMYDKAIEQAHRAKALGFNRTELRDLLEQAGEWKDPAQ